MRRVAGIVIQSRLIGSSAFSIVKPPWGSGDVIFCSVVELDVSFVISGVVVFCLICIVNILLLSENSS